MALTPITAAPTSISAERWAELTSSTPASFSDTPPVLRWEDDASIELASPGWTAWGPAAGSSSGSVSGRLYVTEDAVSFLPSPAAQLPGFALPFPALTLHALTPAGGERPAHIYCQLDESAVAPGANGAAPVVDDEEEYAELGEMRVFVPADKLDGLFAALSACSALHDSLLPSGDPASFFGFGRDDDDEEDQWDDNDEADDDGAFDDAEDGAVGGAGGRDAAQEPEANVADDDDDDDDDAVSAFLAKVDWSRATPAGAATEWVDVAPGDVVDFSPSEVATLRAANAELTRSLAAEQAAHATTRARVRELEKELQRVKTQVQVRAERVMGVHMAAPAPEGPL